VPFFNTVSEEPRWYVILSIAVVQPRLYLQYFLSRLNQTRFYNHACKPYITAINYLFSTSVVNERKFSMKSMCFCCLGFDLD